MAEETKRWGVLGKIIILVIIVAIAVAGFVFFGKNKNTSSIIDSGKYQAVFLTNGQTYFGKVSNEKSAYVSLSDVYYLVLKRPLQNQQQEGEQPQEQPKPEYSLIKLGKEMHGPISMSINKDQILFIENLADDSKVVSTIKNQK
ncbi:MAG: hypothetical protein Q7U36_01475 [bacterium]|nr:hypothetical protein [bacterium]